MIDLVMRLQSLRYIERAAVCGDTTQQLDVFLDRAIWYANTISSHAIATVLLAMILYGWFSRYKAGQFPAALEDCDQVLQGDASNVEALYCRASSLLDGPTREVHLLTNCEAVRHVPTFHI
jgi:hypothetical protein